MVPVIVRRAAWICKSAGGLRMAVALACASAAAGASAADFGQADGFDIRWDTTLRDTLVFRTEPAAAGLLANINGDDGDRAFQPGLVSSRLYAFSEFTATRDQLGFDISAQGWYDPLYFQGSANNSPATFNPLHVSYDQFPPATRALLGADAELMNAFVKDQADIAGVPVSLRLGRQVLLWGESLFFANNGIAAGQAPLDDIKAQSEPLAEARELYLPVTQAVLRAQIMPDFAIEAYDQFEWRRDRLPGVASYFSTVDYLDTGGDRVLLPGGGALYRTNDETPSGIGQFGVAVRLQSDALDAGLYGLRYSAKLPEPVFDAAASTYRLVFPSGIDVLGASASTYAGDSNIAGELSWRHGMPLAPSGTALAAAGASPSGPVYAAAYAASLPALPPPPAPWPYPPSARGGYATGDTWHGQASMVSQLPPSHWWQGASLQAELAANDLIGVDTGHGFVQPGRTHFAASAQAVFTPSYFQVLPGLDIGLPLGLEYNLLGRSSIDAGQNAGAGNVTLGVTATYRVVWQASFSFTHFIGGAGAQPLADRDYAALSISRTF